MQFAIRPFLVWNPNPHTVSRAVLNFAFHLLVVMALLIELSTLMVWRGNFMRNGETVTQFQHPVRREPILF
jgi:hypothetical protein